MAPPDGARGKRIPTLSWESVVDETATGASEVTSSPVAERVDAGSDQVGEIGGVDVEIAFEPLHLDDAVTDRASTPRPTVVPSEPPAPPSRPAAARPPAASPAPPPAAPPVVSPAPAPPTVVAASEPVAASASEPAVASGSTLVAAPEPAPAPLAEPTPTPERQEVVSAPVPAEEVESVVRTTPPAVIVPAIGDVTSGPDSLTSAAHVSDAVPEIREATPVTPIIEPALPSVPVPVPTAVPTAFEFESVPAPATTTRSSTRRRGGRRGLKLLFTLVVLAGLVAAGVVFGQPYLFPSDWNSATAPYAEAVESARGVEFVEPLAITAEPTADFADRLRAEVAGDVSDQLPAWRALGLAVGDVDDDALAQLLAEWQDAVYSSTDGQVYQDQGAAGPELDAQLTQAMVAAALDQEYRWSVDQPGRTLDAAATTSAEVLAQSRRVQTSSTYDARLDPAAPASVDSLPAVVGYRMLAPRVFAEFRGAETPEPNPLAGLGPEGPGPLGVDTPAPAVEPALVDGDVITASPIAMDRSFWFMVFGSFLDGPTAYSASRAVVENSMTGAVRGTTACVYATFSGTAVESTETLRSALQAWSAAAPAEFASSFGVLPDGSLQLTSCDPGPAFQAPIRPGVARDVVAWRAAELATHDAVVAAGGSDEDVAGVWGLIGASDVPRAVAALPAGTSPADIAATAREQVAAVYTP
jgi:hypothetical protein